MKLSNNTLSSLRLCAALSALLVVTAARAEGQCVGDCSGDNGVSITELVTGVNIALEATNIDRCPAFDANESGSVEIDEIVSGIGNSIDGCPVEPTATPTLPEATPTPTVSGLCGNGNLDEGEECDDGNLDDGDGCQSNCMLSRCGDGIVDNLLPEDPETCDDGNTVEGYGDICPANCRVRACEASGDKLTVNFDFSTENAGTFVSGLQLFIRYPDGVVSIPGSSAQPSVLERISSPTFPPPTVNDINFALTAILFDQFGVEPGTALSIEFDLCQGAPAPEASDFTCTVDSASDDQLMDITDQVTCTPALR